MRPVVCNCVGAGFVVYNLLPSTRRVRANAEEPKLAARRLLETPQLHQIAVQNCSQGHRGHASLAMARLIRGAMLVSVLCTMPAVLGQVPELEGRPDPASLAHGSTEWQVLDQPVSMMKLGTSGGAIDFEVGPRSASGSEGLPGGRVQVLGWRSAPQYKFFPWQARCSFAARAARVRRSPIPGAAGLPTA